jgi:hypothetical protein
MIFCAMQHSSSDMQISHGYGILMKSDDKNVDWVEI